MTALAEFVEQINRSGGTYHLLPLSDGLMIDGDYDMAKYVRYYCLPQDLKGKTVLDIGTSTGYFALETARRGAKVTAIDIWEWTPLIDLTRLLSLIFDI